MNKDVKVRCSMWLYESQIKELDKIARRSDSSRGRLLRIILNDFFERESENTHGTIEH